MADSGLVRVAITGAVSFAPVGTTAPTDASTPLDPEDWRDVGYLSEDGVVEARERSSENIIAWQNASVVRTVTTEATITVNFTMIESNPNSLALFYGEEVSGVDGSVEITPANSGGRRAVVIDYADGESLIRLYLPEAEVTEVGEANHTSNAAIGYEVTLTGYPGPDGWSAKKWFSDLVEQA